MISTKRYKQYGIGGEEEGTLAFCLGKKPGEQHASGRGLFLPDSQLRPGDDAASLIAQGLEEKLRKLGVEIL